MLSIQLPLNRVRVNIEPSGERQIVAAGTAILNLDTVDFEESHPDQQWLKQMSVASILTQSDSERVHGSLRKRATDSPSLVVIEMAHADWTLYVQAAVPPGAFEQLWSLIMHHLGSSAAYVEVSCGLTGYYDATLRDNKTLRESLERSEKLLTGASLSVVAKDWSA
jgi:hypothetical protein